MLRLVLVFGIVLLGFSRAARSGFSALLLYLWLAYFRPQEWVWNAAILEALDLSLVAGVLLLLRTPAAGAKFRFDARAALLFLLLFLALMSTLTSLYFAYAWPYWIEFAKVIVITYLISCYSTDLPRYRQILLVIAFSLGFEGAKQGWVQLLTNPAGKNINEFPLLGDNNGVAVGMLMLVALFIGLAQTATRRWEKSLHIFFAVGVAFRAISTYSRGGFLSAAALALVYVVRSKQKLKAAVAMVAVGGVILSVLPQEYWDRMGTIEVDETKLQAAGDNEADASSLSRLYFWRVAVSMAAANPVLGVGFNAYNRAYNTYDVSGGMYGRSRSVHSSWFGPLAELGYPGFVVYVLCIVMAIAACQSVTARVRKGLAHPDLYHYAVSIQTGFAVFLVGGTFVPWQYCEMLWHFVGLSMGLRVLAHAAAPVPAAAPQPAPRAVTRFQPRPATAMRGT